MTPTDAELIQRVAVADDRAAFGELVLRHQSAVRRFLQSLSSGDAALADDLAQETFIQAYRGLARFRGEASFSTWLLGIAHNYWRNAHRRRNKHAIFSGALSETEPAPAPMREADLRHDLAAALRQLSPDEQTAVHLSYQQGLSHSEIADVLGWPIGTVKTHLTRSKEKLRQLLAAWNPQT